MAIEFSIPVKIVSEANVRGRWRTKWQRVRGHKQAAYLLTLQNAREFINPKRAIRVTMIRHGKRLLDSDNLESGFKATRDGIAKALEIDDGDPICKWDCDQVALSPDYSATVMIEWRDPR